MDEIQRSDTAAADALDEATPQAEMPVSPSAAPAVGRRIAGLDAARAVAIIGMVMVHFGPTDGDPFTWTDHFYRLSHGRAALLFVLLAGIGVTLLAGGAARAKWRRGWPRLAARVAVLLPLGLALELLRDVRVLVILHYYALYFLLAAPAVFLRDRLLLAAAGVVAVAGPVGYWLVSTWRPAWMARYGSDVTMDTPLEIVRDLLLTGSYPAVVWMAPVLFGMWLGRRRFDDAATRGAMLLGGALAVGGAAVLDAGTPDAGWWQLASTEPHNQMIAWLVGGMGSAVAVLALCLLACDRMGRWMWPLVAMGQLALTVYVGHLLLMAAVGGLLPADRVGPALVYVASFTIAAALFAMVWRRWFTRGPLEALLHGFGAGLGRLLYGARDGDI
ncbi:MAG: acyltransferase family protein [Phycisphaeraceae bacterium]